VTDAEEIHAETNFSSMGRHLLLDCESCHPGMPEADFRRTASECISCHRADYDAASSPKHSLSGFSTDCRRCHLLTAWTPANMSEHDAAFFPIYSGTHLNQWSDCSSCHTVPGNNSIVSCIDCHQHSQASTDPTHRGMPGYSYSSTACLTCHPTGIRRDYLDHDAEFFPIYSGTHLNQWSDCTSCHTGTGKNAGFSCTDCHQHSQTATDPTHSGMPGYSYTSTSCFDCHPTGVKSDYLEHDAAFFPIYSGTHVSQWSDCSSCHTVPGNNAVFSCTGCHQHRQTAIDPTHNGMPGYLYTSTSCLDCHPTGTTGDYLEHDAAFFPIYSGTHVSQWSDCSSCHTVPGNNAVFSCTDCHQHSQAVTDPTHSGMPGYSYTSTSCFDCHPTGTTGDYLEHDAAFFPIYSGTHLSQWSDCSSCHTVPGNNAVFSCTDCHQHSQTATDPTHSGMPGYSFTSTSCFDCHPTGTTGDYLEHDASFFPIYSGTHVSQWSDCSSCHAVQGNNTVFSCTDCHQHSQTAIDPTHDGMPGYSYTSTSCLDCHPTGTTGDYLEHDASFFPIYSGTHLSQWSDCSSCHTVPGNNTVFSCTDCHNHSQAVTDPTHSGMPGYSYTSTSCLDCHPTGIVSDYLEHDASFFPIYSGTHLSQWSDCSSCHTVPGNNAVFSCTDCHQHSQTAIDPTHNGMPGYSYTSTSCLDCHPAGTTGDYIEHDAAFFPIYSGTHVSQWSECFRVPTATSIVKLQSIRHITACWATRTQAHRA
jgi:hypothetical protein